MGQLRALQSSVLDLPRKNDTAEGLFISCGLKNSLLSDKLNETAIDDIVVHRS